MNTALSNHDRDELLAGLAEHLKLPVDVVEDAIREDLQAVLMLLEEAEEQGEEEAPDAL